MNQSIPLPYWEWWIVLYFFVGGLGGAAYAIACLLDFLRIDNHRPVIRAGWMIGFPASILSAICLIWDLGRPERFLNMIVDVKNGFLPNPKIFSPISVGSYILLAFGALTFLHWLYALHQSGQLQRWGLGGIGRLAARIAGGTFGRLLSALGVLVGFLLGGYTSVLLSTTHFPAWSQNWLLGALFVASAVSCGMAAIGLVLALRGEAVSTDTWSGLKALDNYAILVEILALVGTLTLFAATSTAYLRPMNLVLLIGGVLVLGLLTPLLLQWRSAFSGEKSNLATTLSASMLVLLGGLILRAIIVLAPQGFM